MPIDFDESDIDGVVQEVETAAASQPAVRPATDIEVEMDEVEARLEMAQYYRLILQESLFADAPNPSVAAAVESEIRDFIRGRMQVLVGVGSGEKAVKGSFSEPEIQALKTLASPDVASALKAVAAKVLKKPSLMETQAPLAPEEKKPKVIKTPVLKKVVQGASKDASIAAKQAAEIGGKKAQVQKKRIVTEVTDDGREIKRDLTPQARPTGPIQPIPTPRGRHQIEAVAAQAAHQHAAAALENLNTLLTGKR